MATRRLPSFVEPMLAKPGDPFDSEQYQFEVKWDGFRAIAWVDEPRSAGSDSATPARHQIISRRRVSMNDWFPELECLGQLPAGTILDGEVVSLDDAGNPSFARLLRRKRATSPKNAQLLLRTTPVTYIAFDVLYVKHQSVMDLPLEQRMDLLGALMEPMAEPRLIQSDVFPTTGRALYDAAVARGLEGVVAKRLNSRYQPGKRSGAWVKFKRKEDLLCAIIGYMPKGANDFESLIVATDEDGDLTCVGRVGSGFSDPLRAELVTQLQTLSVDAPIIPCTHRGRWVLPELFCRVRYTERSVHGELRDPVFVEMID